MRMPERLNRMLENLAQRAAWALPRRVVKWAAIRVAAEATTGKYSSVEAPSLTAIDAIAAWDRR